MQKMPPICADGRYHTVEKSQESTRWSNSFRVSIVVGRTEILPPLCKGRWRGAAASEGLSCQTYRLPQGNNPSVSFTHRPHCAFAQRPAARRGNCKFSGGWSQPASRGATAIADSSLYTREPGKTTWQLLWRRDCNISTSCGRLSVVTGGSSGFSPQFHRECRPRR